MSSLETLRDTKTMLLTSYKRDGTAVGRTPFIGPPGVRVGGLGWVAG